jgi:cell division protein FtsZ
MKGARGVLINITGGMDMTLFEVDEAANRIRDEVDPDANIIFGSTFDQSLEGKIRISVVATGIDAQAVSQPRNSGAFGNLSLVPRAVQAQRPATEHGAPCAGYDGGYDRRPLCRADDGSRRRAAGSSAGFGMVQPAKVAHRP